MFKMHFSLTWVGIHQQSTAYLCKHPAAPAPVASVLKEGKKPPTRNAKGEWVFADFPEFHPNLSPAEVLKVRCVTPNLSPPPPA